MCLLSQPGAPCLGKLLAIAMTHAHSDSAPLACRAHSALASLCIHAGTSLQVLFAINELGVPEALEQGPCSGAQLAAVCGCHQPYLERVLRLAARLQLVGVSEPPGATAGDPGARMYSLTQLSAVLCSSHPNSVKAMVSLFADHYAPFERLVDGVRRGETPYRLYSGGKSHWDHMREHPKLLQRFNRCARKACCFSSPCTPGTRALGKATALMGCRC
jgi:hypothetical protein